MLLPLAILGACELDRCKYAGDKNDEVVSSLDIDLACEETSRVITCIINDTSYGDSGLNTYQFMDNSDGYHAFAVTVDTVVTEGSCNLWLYETNENAELREDFIENIDDAFMLGGHCYVGDEFGLVMCTEQTDVMLQNFL